MGELFTRLESPVMRELAIEWPDGSDNVEMFPGRLPDLYAGEPLVFSARLPNTKGSVGIRGIRANETWSSTIPLQGGRPQSGVGVLWARNKIADLMDTLRAGASKSEVRASVVEVALRHHLVSKYTSLVAVDVTPARSPDEDLVKRALPTNLPAGWKYEKVFGPPPRTATPAALHLLTGGLMLLAGLFAMAPVYRSWARRA